MRFSSTLASLALFTGTVSAQGSASLESKEGYQTTDIFLPYATNGSYIAALGSSNDTTTWGYAEDEAQLTDSPTTFTLEPTRLVYNVSTANVTEIGTVVFLSAFIILSCSYTSTSSEAGKTTWHVTAACSESTKFENDVTGRNRAGYFTLPEFYRPTLTDGSAGNGLPTASSDGGWVGVYAKKGGMPTSTQGGGGAEVTAMVKKVVVVAAGAVAFVV